MNEQQIRIARGTEYRLPIDLYDGDGNEYMLGKDEKLILGIINEYAGGQSNVVFTCEAERETVGGYVVIIAPENTAALPPGRYYYDVNLYRADGTPVNVVEMSAFDIVQSSAPGGAV